MNKDSHSAVKQPYKWKKKVSFDFGANRWMQLS